MAELDLHRELRHPPERVWQALTGSEALGRWLGPTDLRPEAGTRFTLTLTGPPWFGQVVRGEVLEVEPGRRLVLRWRHGSQDTRVELRLEPIEGGTRVRVQHRGFRGVGGALLAWLLLGWWGGALRAVRGELGLGGWGWLLPGAAAGVGLLLVGLWGLGGGSVPVEVRDGQVAGAEAVASPGAEVGVRSTEPATKRPPRARRARPGGSATPVHGEGSPASEPEAEPADEEPVALREEAPDRLVGPSRWSNPERFAMEGGPTGELRLEETGRQDTLNPLFARSGPGARLVDLAFDTLFAVDAQGTVISRLVARSESWPAGNGVDLWLRPEVRWQDGQPLRPADVCFSVQAWTRVAGPQRAFWRDRLDGCEVDGDRVRVGVRGAWGDARRALELVVLPAHAFEEEALEEVGRDHPFGWEPVGTGPFEGRWTRTGAVFRAAEHGSRVPRLATIRVDGVVGTAEDRVADVGGALDALMGVPEGRAPGAGTALPGEELRWFVVLKPEGPLADEAVRKGLLARVDPSVLDGRAVAQGLTPFEPAFVVRLGALDAPPGWSHALRNQWQAQGLDVLAWERSSSAASRDPHWLDDFAEGHDAALVGRRAGATWQAVGRGPHRPFARPDAVLTDGPAAGSTERELGREQRWLVVSDRVDAVGGTVARPYLNLDRWTVR